eukprot:3848690-Amphidinium_carterae.1
MTSPTLHSWFLELASHVFDSLCLRGQSPLNSGSWTMFWRNGSYRPMPPDFQLGGSVTRLNQVGFRTHGFVRAHLKQLPTS